MADALDTKVLADLDSWNSWLDTNGVEGCVGEFGFPGDNPEYWPGDAVLWRTLGEAYYDRLQTHGIWSMQWAASEAFAGYELAPYTGAGVGSAINTARPQSIPLENHAADAGVRRGLAVTGLSFNWEQAGFSNTTPGTLHSTFFANIAGTWNYIGGRGVDFARIDFRWERIQPTLGAALDPTHLALLQQQVDRAVAAGMDVCLDCHNYGSYFTTGHVERKLGSAQLTNAHFADLWDRLSQAFAAETGVVAYGLMNEPHDMPGGAAAWETASQAAVDAIRTNGDTKAIFVSGHGWGKVQGWASEHSNAWIVDPDDNFRYEAHHYWDTAPSSIIGAEDSVYGQTYDSAVADLSPTVYIRDPRPSETMVGPITVRGVRNTSASTSITLRVYPGSSSTPVHTQTFTASSREWSVALGVGLSTGAWRIQADQAGVLSPMRSFSQASSARKNIALPAGPTNSWHGPDTDSSSGDPFAAVLQSGNSSPRRFAQCADFADSPGINHKSNVGGLDNQANWDTAIDRIQELGFRHVRIGLFSLANHSSGYEQAQLQGFVKRVRERNDTRGVGVQPIGCILGTTTEPQHIVQFGNVWNYGIGGVNTQPSLAIGSDTLSGTPTPKDLLRPLDGPPIGGSAYLDVRWGPVAGWQSPNEPDNGRGWFPVNIRAYNRALMDAKSSRTQDILAAAEYVDFATGRIASGPKVPQMLVAGFHMVNGNNWAGMGDYTDKLDLDVGAPHVYWGGHEPNFTEFWDPGNGQWSNMSPYNGALSAGGRYSRTIPIVVTETGYLTHVSGDGGSIGPQRHCPPDVAGEYLIRTLLQNYIGGIKRTYIYKLTHESIGPDPGATPPMGICEIDFDRLACFYALKNLMGLVGFTQGPDNTPFDVAVSGFTAGAPNVDDNGGYQSPDRLDRLVLRKSATEWLVILTRQRSLWSRWNQTYKTVTDPRTVTLTLPAGAYTAAVAEPAKNLVDSPNDGLTYPGQASPGATADGTTYAPLTIGAGNTIQLQVAGLTRVVKVTAITVPAVTITDPTPGETVSDTTPTLTGTAGNAAGDSANVVVTTYAGATATGTPVLGPTNVARSGTAWSHTLGTLAEGTYTSRATQAGTNGTSAPVDRTFSVLLDPIDPPPIPLPPPIRVTVREKPRTDLHLLVTTPNSRKYRWSDSDKRPQYAPSDLRFSTSMPGGFETQECVLPRKPNVDYQDLKRLTDIDVRAPGGAQVWEGRLERAPKSSGDRITISPSAVGYQAELEDDRAARFLGIDRNLADWQGMSLERQNDVEGDPAVTGPSDGSTITDDNGEPAVELKATAPWAFAARPVVESWYDAKGLPIGALYYAWRKSPRIGATDPDWHWSAYLANDALASAYDTTGELRAAGPGQGILFPTTQSRKWALLQLSNTDTGGLDAAFSNWMFAVWFTHLAVFGDHGLTWRTAGALPAGQLGLYASDIVRHVVPKFAPRLKVTAESIEASNFIIEQFAYPEPTTVAEIVKQASRFELQDWAVWGNRTFYWNRRGSRGKHWRARLRPSQLQETGPTMDRLWSSIVVRYQDVSGVSRTVGPPGSGCDTESPLLKDDDPENPANQIGKTRRDVLEMGVSVPLAAIEIGYKFLQETKALDSSGDATLVGHVRDDKGVLYPASRVRAGDDITFIDASDRSARRIIKTEYSHSNRSCQVSLDAPAEGLSALLDRMAVRLSPHGFG